MVPPRARLCTGDSARPAEEREVEGTGEWRQGQPEEAPRPAGERLRETLDDREGLAMRLITGALLIVAAGVFFLAAVVSLNAAGEQPTWPTRIGFGAATLCGAVGGAYLVGGLTSRRRRLPR
jgi:hypothetical protein